MNRLLRIPIVLAVMCIAMIFAFSGCSTDLLAQYNAQNTDGKRKTTGTLFTGFGCTLGSWSTEFDGKMIAPTADQIKAAKTTVSATGDPSTPPSSPVTAVPNNEGIKPPPAPSVLTAPAPAAPATGSAVSHPLSVAAILPSFCADSPAQTGP